MQGRSYAISLSSQIVIVVLAYIPKASDFPSKPETISVHPISARSDNRVEIRIALPYGAVKPSDEKKSEAR